MKTHLKYCTKFVRKNLEALMWLAGLTYLFIINPYSGNHLSMCAFDLAGFDFCPGCGLGRSISLIFHGDISGSFEMHPLGMFALTVLLYRVVSLFAKNFKYSNRTMEVYNG